MTLEQSSATWRAVTGRMAEPRFWSDYYGMILIFDDGVRPIPTTIQLPIDVGDGGLLELEIDGWLTYSALRLEGEWLGRDGGDEQYPPYPDALRCDRACGGDPDGPRSSRADRRITREVRAGRR